MRFFALLTLLATPASAAVLSLTDANFAEKTAGKTVFIKFFAPWCGHCQALAPDWETLADDWEGHKVGLVAEVDCDQQDELCARYEIQGFPTLLYGEPSDLEPYEGSRDLDALQQFAKDNISKPVCSIHNQDACDKATKKKIGDLEKKSVDDLKQMLKDADTKVREAESGFEEKLMKLQAEYEEMESSFQADVKKIKDDADYKYLRSILQKKGVSLDDEDDDMDDFDDDELEHDEF